MPKALKFILSPLVLLVILALPSFYGCSGGETTTTTPAWATISVEQLTQQQLQQMLADSIDKYEKLNTYKFNIGMDISTNVTGGENPWDTVLNTTMSGGTNIGDEQTKMTLDMTIAMTGMGQDNQEQSLVYDIYAMPDWLYMNMSISDLGKQWLKVKMSSSLKDLLNLDAVDQQMQPLESPTKIEYLRTEQVDGIVCYVLSVSPSSVQLAEWLKEQNVNTGNTDWENLVNNTDVFKNVSLLYYVAKDSNLMMRMVMKMTIELSAAEAGASSTEFDNMSMILITDMKLSDHNQPFSVTLPDEADSATEVSEDIFK